MSISSIEPSEYLLLRLWASAFAVSIDVRQGIARSTVFLLIFTLSLEGSLPLEEVEKLQQNAKIIIDLSHANRQGLTINAITALAKGKKLITTNKRIVEESFYSPTNIYILDDKKPSLDAEWLKTPPQPVDMSSLRMDNWLRTVLE